MHTYGSEYFEAIASTPGLHQLKFNTCSIADFELLVLRPGEFHSFHSAHREYGIVVLTGSLDISIGDQVFKDVGGRSSVFAGPPSMAFASRESQVSLRAITATEIALCSAKCDRQTLEPYLVAPKDCIRGEWGKSNTRRTYNHMINKDRPSERLWLAEVTVENGNWATYPPHKHEEGASSPGEIFQEEMYFYRVEPATGFGFCALFEGKVQGDYAFLIRNNTIQKMPYGYHTVTVAPGYKVWYLALYAGHDKQHSTAMHPDHRWHSTL